MGVKHTGKIFLKGELIEKEEENLSRSKAIKLFCKHDCSAGSHEDMKNCTCTSCWLFPYREGAVNEEFKSETKSKRGIKKMSEEHKRKLMAARDKAAAKKNAAK